MLNLGAGAAGPGFLVSDPILIEYINRASLAIVQVVSGRSTSNSLFKVKDHSMMGTRLSDGRNMSAPAFYDDLLQSDIHLAREIVAETRRNYVQAMIETLTKIQVPKILFWFSVRTPEYEEKWTPPASGILSDFPQLVNREMINQLLPFSEHYVECVSRTGLPQPIPPRDPAVTATLDLPSPLPQVELTWMNRYYPSPEMHEEAADLLEPVCREIFEG